MTVILRFKKEDENATLPRRAHNDDAGMDVTAVSLRYTDKFIEFDTGISLQEISPGWYLDLVPRSSITKTGYILLNSVGIIDRTYRGRILYRLERLNPENTGEIDEEKLKKCMQLIPRPQVSVDVQWTNKCTNTQRGVGGFGSTDS